jgi:5-formyltetrahydrofolate cyclo-ligase
VAAPAAPLVFHLADPGELVGGRFGLSEPADTAPEVAASALDAVLVPGLAFDAQGRRLGLGGGFYDRTFSQARRSQARRPPLFGFCSDLQGVSACPSGPEDVPVDLVVTESRVLRREPPR